jgi:hypothetical protein
VLENFFDDPCDESLDIGMSERYLFTSAGFNELLSFLSFPFLLFLPCPEAEAEADTDHDLSDGNEDL